MLVRLFPQQIPDHWDFIKYSLEKTFVSRGDDQEFHGVLGNLLIDKMICWVITDKDNKICGITITTVTQDYGSSIHGVLIYSFYLFDRVDISSIRDALNTIMSYAEDLGVSEIVAYSNVSRIWRVAEGLGADVETRRISFPLGG